MTSRKPISRATAWATECARAAIAVVLSALLWFLALCLIGAGLIVAGITLWLGPAAGMIAGGIAALVAAGFIRKGMA